MSEHLLTVAEVATELRCCAQAVRNLIRDGELEALKLVGRWKVSAESLARFRERASERAELAKTSARRPRGRPRRLGVVR